MLFGLNVFASNTFAKQFGTGFQYWNEVCPNDTTWTVMNPRIVGLRTCADYKRISAGINNPTESEG
jgi:hypothetical protein